MVILIITGIIIIIIIIIIITPIITPMVVTKIVISIIVKIIIQGIISTIIIILTSIIAIIIIISVTTAATTPTSLKPPFEVIMPLPISSTQPPPLQINQLPLTNLTHLLLRPIPLHFILHILRITLYIIPSIIL